MKGGRRLTTIEVKSGRAPLAHAGSAAFAQAFKVHRTLLVGGRIRGALQNDAFSLVESIPRTKTHQLEATPAAVCAPVR